MELLRTGCYWRKAEEAQLASRAEEKERTGKKARRKRMNERSCALPSCVEIDPSCNTCGDSDPLCNTVLPSFCVQD
eukprot:6477311-Karenia_brevis.AAC.1